MMEEGQPILLSLYVYAPNKVAPIIFIVAYAVSAVGHIWQCTHYKSWKLIGLHPFCAVLFTAGYALREYGAYNYLYRYDSLNLIIYVLSQVFIYVCPPLLELANYHVLGRIFYYVPYFAPLPPGRVLSTFGLLVALVEILNALGVALASNRKSTNSGLGSKMIVAALAMQLAVIIFFVVIAAFFHWRCAKAKLHTKTVKTPLITLYASMVLILIRCVYRLVEHLGGNSTIVISDLESMKALTPILRYEWYFYVFESTIMLLNSILWNIWSPGRFLPKGYHIYLAQDGKTEVNGELVPDTRPLLAKAGSVLTFGFFFAHKREHRQFHELNEYHCPVSPIHS